MRDNNKLSEGLAKWRQTKYKPCKLENTLSTPNLFMYFIFALHCFQQVSLTHVCPALQWEEEASYHLQVDISSMISHGQEKIQKTSRIGSKTTAVMSV